MPLKKTTAAAGLGIVALVLLFALVSFWQENWSANQSPGVVERIIARWLLSVSRGAAKEIPNPVSATEANLTEGRELFEKQCAFCHGADGNGSSGSGVQFYPPVPSLVVNDRKLTDAQMHAVVSQGVRYTAMPSFANAIREDQIWKILLWVHQLPAATTDQRAAPAGGN
jgi:mono/diheme cytochrome c family protein